MVAGALAAQRGEEPPPEEPMARPTLRPVSRHRWCTNLLVADGDGAERVRELGDSVMIARDGDATRVHVDTDDPNDVVALFAEVLQVDVSDMRPPTTAFALAPGFESLFASLGVEAVSELAPFDGGSVTLIAVPQAALVASIAFDAARPPEENSAALLDAIARVRTASVPAGGELAPAVAALADGAELLTVVTGEDAPLSEEEIRALVPANVELEVTPGAPAPWWWLIAAE
jgi:hypothetical protein